MALQTDEWDQDPLLAQGWGPQPMPGTVPDWSNLHNGNGTPLPEGTILQAGVNPNAKPAAAPTPAGYTGPKDSTSLIHYWQQTHPATAPDIDGMIAFLAQNGVSAQRATHAGGALSDDKITINGQMFDLGSSLGGPGASWFADFAPMGNESAGSLSGLLDPYSGTFTAPNADQASADVLKRFPGLPTIDPFVKPDANAMQLDPGYQFRAKQGADALQHGAAARGILRTGGSLKDLLAYGQDFASNEYDKVFNRDLTTYKTNVGNTLDLYDRAFNRSVTGEVGANTAYDRSWNQFQQDWNMYNTDQRNRLDLLTGTANRGVTAAGA
jgi:hypothetical protein